MSSSGSSLFPSGLTLSSSDSSFKSLTVAVTKLILPTKSFISKVNVPFSVNKYSFLPSLLITIIVSFSSIIRAIFVFLSADNKYSIFTVGASLSILDTTAIAVPFTPLLSNSKVNVPFLVNTNVFNPLLFVTITSESMFNVAITFLLVSSFVEYVIAPSGFSIFTFSELTYSDIALSNFIFISIILLCTLEGFRIKSFASFIISLNISKASSDLI